MATWTPILLAPPTVVPPIPWALILVTAQAITTIVHTPTAILHTVIITITNASVVVTAPVNVIGKTDTAHAMIDMPIDTDVTTIMPDIVIGIGSMLTAVVKVDASDHVLNGSVMNGNTLIGNAPSDQIAEKFR